MSKYTIKLSQQRENEGEPFSTEDKGSAVRYFERLRVPVGQRKLLYEGNNIVVTSTCVDEKGVVGLPEPHRASEVAFVVLRRAWGVVFEVNFKRSDFGASDLLADRDEASDAGFVRKSKPEASSALAMQDEPGAPRCFLHFVRGGARQHLREALRPVPGSSQVGGRLPSEAERPVLFAAHRCAGSQR